MSAGILLTSRQESVSGRKTVNGLLGGVTLPSTPFLFMVEDIPFVQSVLFKSPYSGCQKFSGFTAVAPKPKALRPIDLRQKERYEWKLLRRSSSSA